LHFEKKTRTVEFKSDSISALKNDPNVYSKYFSKAMNNLEPIGEKPVKHSIQYTVDYLFLNAEDYSKSHGQFIKLLSNTTNLSYFRSPFI
jgi:hypothetical protein